MNGDLLMKSKMLFLMTALGALGTGAYAQTLNNPFTLLEVGHTDLQHNYDDGWEFEVETSTDAYEPDDVLLYLNPSTRRNANSTIAGLLGIANGAQYWRLFKDQSANPAGLWLGVASEETAPGTFSSYDPSAPGNPGGSFPQAPVGSQPWMRLDLLSVTSPGGGAAPGNLALWNVDDNGTQRVWDTVDGNYANDQYWMLEGGHNHLNWGFSAPGLYEVTLQASGLVGNNYVTSSPVTWHFGVEAAPVPEPATLAALGLGAAALLRRRRKV